MKNQLLDQRLKGELPVIKIADDDYIVDWRLKELRSADGSSRRIDLSKLEMNEEGTEYVALLHLKTGAILTSTYVTGEEKVSELALIYIPNELKLDPVGVAREYGLNDTHLLEDYPIQENLKARIEPLEDMRKNIIEFVNACRKKESANKKKNRGRGI